MWWNFPFVILLFLCTALYSYVSEYEYEYRIPKTPMYLVPAGGRGTVPKRKTSCFGWRADIPIKQDDAADIPQSIYSEMPYQASKSIFRQYGRNLGGRGAFR